MVSGTSTPLVVSGEQLVHSKESKENSSSTNFEISTEGTNDATNNVSTSSTESINSSQTAEQEEATTDQTQDSMENNESETDQTQDNAENNESETNQTQETTEQDEPPTVDDSPEVTKQAQDDEEAEINAIGKGENFNGKLYLNYFGKKVKNVFATSAIPAVGLMMLVINQIMEKNVKERFDVGVDTIQNLITTYILYDIAFAKDSSLMSLANSQNDGTTPAENTGFYPNTQQIKGTALNNQDGKMMDLYAYYVNQNSDKTVIIHGGFRGNWNNGIVMDEYNDFYQAGYNMIFVESRATGTSGGDFVTYGQYESDDVLYWINREISERPQQKILLYGGSMGAATMMSVLAKNIPTNVKGIIENCGFKSIDEQLRFTYSSTVAPLLSQLLNILNIVADKEHEDLYLGLLKEYYFDREMNLNTTGNLPVKGMMNATIPKLIIHGSIDSVVTVSNAQELFELSSGYKDLLIVEGADHGEAQKVDPQAYQQHIAAFMDMVFNRSVIVKYVDENNQNLLNDQEALQLQGAYGDRYKTEQKKFAGYEFVKIEGEQQGIFNEVTPTVIYHYKKIMEEPIADNTNENNINNVNNVNNNVTNKDHSNQATNNSSASSKGSKKEKTNQKKKAFPLTGDQQGIKISLAGSAFLLISLVGWLYQRRRGGKMLK
ncbi:alpha/beta fold hydrolase [Enterococcus ratti]|uniref:LPXTG-domain-containing protein cell wall anchor domain n=1 Tax=Enterococcus ratti TaxID=150033 RepID=A0A1L8WPZ8_9ENTE|nr:alpha/beta fold hydrolase [Enterococcus ratti]OJG83098.1 hypothetical protein RV14_GL001793 [Enterococcus ratti]